MASRKAPAGLMARFSLGGTGCSPRRAPAPSVPDRSGLHVSPEVGGYVLRDGARWIADYESHGATRAGLEVERRRAAARKEG